MTPVCKGRCVSNGLNNGTFLAGFILVIITTTASNVHSAIQAVYNLAPVDRR